MTEKIKLLHYCYYSEIILQKLDNDCDEQIDIKIRAALILLHTSSYYFIAMIMKVNQYSIFY